MNSSRSAFYKRHIGLDDGDIAQMLEFINMSSLDELSEKALPDNIKLKQKLELSEPFTEADISQELERLLSRNKIRKSFIGQGYFGTFLPEVIKRNILENPAWYTAYTPYQAEISQGRLEMLFHFQTMISDLTGLPVANASLLDEGTAAAEACAIAFRHFKNKRNKIYVYGDLNPQTLAVIKTRVLGSQEINTEKLDENTSAIILALPDNYGIMNNVEKIIAKAKKLGCLVIFICDPLALTILRKPSDMGADIVVGTTQRFGVSMGFGGPAAAYMAVVEKFTRQIPGRIVGKSIDRFGQAAYRLAIQTREQHIRRDKATSNICTSQVLLANIATAYAIWHRGEGLQAIAHYVHNIADVFAQHLLKTGYELLGERFFDTIAIKTKQAEHIQNKAYEKGILLRRVSDLLIVNMDETTTFKDLEILLSCFNIPYKEDIKPREIEASWLRQDELLPFEVFKKIKSETEMMRFLRHLSDKDLALDRAMIPLGSCTMKLNAAIELKPLSDDRWMNLHPFAPEQDSLAYQELIVDLEKMLKEITGFSKVSFQPNSGAQGEYAGLLAIRKYLESKGELSRNICLIPASAHGTNPASASLAGFEVVIVECSENGDINIKDLDKKAELYKNKLAALMITYPSTHGVYEEDIVDICNIIHKYGGQVYFDGANLNALVGLARPGDIGADVCHMNLHKTFAIPHGGGGPGAGPIAVAKHLADFLPNNKEGFAVSSAPYGSASILIISWIYIKLMGYDGLRKASQIAILNANYLARKLEDSGYKILYKGKNNLVAHEAIVDTRLLKSNFGITVDDIAKRLIDYGFHAPTMSFPVVGTLMVEPTESESKAEIDRFCDAMGLIYKEAKNAPLSPEDNPLVNAPHIASEAIIGEWKHVYCRETAYYPAGEAQRDNKYFPPVARIDNVHGDRNLICSCLPISEYRK